MRDRAIRNLANLQNSASTTRVLNLAKVAKQFGALSEYKASPFFNNTLLNKSIILKHRLRGHEVESFHDHRSVATKIILPIDRDDLRAGARYAFIGQIGYEGLLSTLVPSNGFDGQQDRRVLELLDALPSFDPFLLREHLRRNGVNPAACYFEISAGDMKRMNLFVQKELYPLVNMSMGGDVDFRVSATALAQKILSQNAAQETELLRATLRMTPDQYCEGVFAWRGFLYYKWSLSEMMAAAPEVADQVLTIQPRGPTDDATRTYLAGARKRIAQAIHQCCSEAEALLDVYDDAFGALTEQANPIAFRDFLLESPAMFLKLGEQIGVISHIVSFWRFCFNRQRRSVLTPHELMDIFLDFEMGLGLQDEVSPSVLMTANARW